MTLKELEAAHEEAAQRLQECRNVIDRESRAAVARIEAQFEDDRVRLQTLCASSRAALDAEKSRLALAGEGAPWPVGTRLTKKERIHSMYYSPSSEPKYATLFGMLEAVTSTTQFPDNLGKWSVPHIGEFIVRLELKGGKLGKKFERPYNWVARSLSELEFLECRINNLRVKHGL